MPREADPSTLEALIRMSSTGPAPMDWLSPAPKRQPNELSQAFQEIDALRKSIPLSFKAKKGGGMIRYKGRF